MWEVKELPAQSSTAPTVAIAKQVVTNRKRSLTIQRAVGFVFMAPV